MSKARRFEIVLLVLAIAMAAFFRLYRLDEVPMGLWRDEAANGVDALRVLRGDRPIFFEANNGREPLFIYLVAVSVGALGRSPLAVRLVSAISGTVTVLVTYFMARELARSAGVGARRVALLTTIWLALSYWHISFSRLGFRGILLPLLAALFSFFLWRGWNQTVEVDRDGYSQPKRRLVYFGASGVCLGLSFYTYIPSKLLPLILLSFFGRFTSRERIAKTLGERKVTAEAVVSSLPFAFAVLGLTAAVVSGPLGYYFLTHPSMFWQRSAQLLRSGAEGGEAFPIAFARNLVTQAAILGVQSDPNILFNPASRPVFEWFTLLFFVAGICISLRNWRKAPFLFALCWLFAMLVPAALSSEDAPHSLRLIGLLPMVYLFPAVGVDWLWTWLEARQIWSSLRYVLGVFIAVGFLIMGFSSYRDYFVPTADEYALSTALDARFVLMASVMNSLDAPNSVWILPLSVLAGDGSAYWVIDFLYAGVAPHQYLPLDESTVAADLGRISDGQGRAMLVEGKDYRLVLDAYADAKGVVSFLLNKYGHLHDTHVYDGFQVSTYELPPDKSFAIADVMQPAGVQFGDELNLLRAAFGGSSREPTSSPREANGKQLPSGNSGWVALEWQATAVPQRDYKVAVSLLDHRGRKAGQVDKLLLSDVWLPTSTWVPGQVELDYYTLPSLPATPPGQYAIEVAVYDAETMNRLEAFDAEAGATVSSISVGGLQVVEPLKPPQVEPTERLAPAERAVAPGLELLGYDVFGRVTSPGELVRLTLYWRATEDVNRDYLLSVRLRAQGDNVWLEQRGRPVDDTYPTTEWDEGEVLRDWHDVKLPADAPEGRHELLLQVLKGREPVGQVSLGYIEVQGRQRQFATPKIQYPMEARLGDGVLFLGYDLSKKQVNPGDALQLTLYWQALEEMEASYTVFTHLLDADNQIWGQMDSIPARGQAPTTSWVEGEVITDKYEMAVDPDAPTGKYVIEIGVYDAKTGERLLVHQMAGQPVGDHILLEKIEVVGTQ
jgi:4-amino-4-deoxy-L-arabinose transferase-like glycosyltransferase